MFTTLEISVSIDDELAALLADYASYLGDDGGLALTSPFVDSGDQTVASTDLAVTDTTAATTPTDLAVDPAPATDLATVVDPMASGDTVVFTGSTAPVTDGSASSTDATDAGDPPPADLAIDPASLPGLDGLIEISDGGFAFDLTILEVGRTFGGPSFMDLP